MTPFFLCLVVSCLSLSTAKKYLYYNDSQEAFDCSMDKTLQSYFFQENVYCKKDKEEMFVYVIQTTCVSLDNSTGSYTLVACSCPYFYEEQNINLTEYADNVDMFCINQSRAGVLCSSCNETTSLALSSYSFRCLPKSQCHSFYWPLFFLAHIGPVTIMFLIFIIFEIKITSGYANIYILYSQAISTQFNSLTIVGGWTSTHYTVDIVLIMLTLYQVWSFQVGSQLTLTLCVPQKIGHLTAIALQYTPVFYAMFLVIAAYILVELYAHRFQIIVWLWKPFSYCFRCCNKRPIEPKTLLINIIAGFYYMSFSQLVEVSLLLLTPSYVHYQHGPGSHWACYFDGSKVFLGSEHRPYVILALLVLILFVFFPLFLIVSYRFRSFRGCLTRCGLNKPGLVIFMNALQGCYKDGSDGGRDCRWFSSYYFFLRIVVFFLYSALSRFRQFFELQIALHLVLLVSLVFLLYVRPYKCHWYNKFDAFLLSYGSFITALTAYGYYIKKEKSDDVSYNGLEVFLNCLIALPLVGAVIYVGEHLFGMKVRFLVRFVRRAYNNRRGRITQSQYEPSHHPPLLRTLSDVSFPDRMLQPDLYENNSNLTGSSYGAI